jgi:hypothetical protein
MCGREAPDRNHGGKMVEANDRMAEPRQDALAKGRRRAPAHEVMGESRCGTNSQ